ncbi:hypothetical protein D9611_005618 [Ephemerocybe angulata]|uniref:Thioredoxin domain-containing protein n=1 Tax=Ephemerocybe angulata TaxID=980116 RepID=A0A8H5BJZ9_9AGAR|nr:hypothetical protein D9611_005618 [Tulosesus angulatus]
MPLYTADSSIDHLSLQTVPEKFIVFYSSVVDGQLWCPDCRDVDPLIKEVFEPEDGPSALIVYVGNRQQWKTPDNIWRQEPWKITGVPSVVRLEDGKPGERLVEDDIATQLKEFVKKQ